jgi:TonB family protein
MKKCEVCGENFEDKYAFCPLDGMPLLISSLPLREGPGMKGNRPRREALTPTLFQREREFDQEVATFEAREFNLTLIGDARLSQRLAIEIQFVVDQIKRAWPSFKNDPIAFTRTEFGELRRRVKQTVARPHVVSGAMTAVLVLSALILGLLFLEKHSPKRTNKPESEELTLLAIDFQSGPTPASDKGVGTGEKGRVGFEKGKGEGSAPRPARSQGGGGSGNRDPKPSSQGRTPIPSVIPAPISTTYARLPRSLPEAGIDIDPVLWKDLRYPNYGDPRSKSTTPSNGSGEGGGVGTGKGTGIGEGEDNGFGPGRKGNIGGNDNSHGCCGAGGSSGNNPNPNEADRVYNPHDVTQRARILFKPEPQYTEEARKNSITGTVILRIVFSRTGEVTNIRAMQSLQGGLTEKAIAAARQIRFVPATRNGQPVSMYMQLEYNFNLY